MATQNKSFRKSKSVPSAVADGSALPRSTQRLSRAVPTSSRSGERGAALITAVLLSLLLLAAGGILLLTTTMTSTTARDSTADMQAYYQAEAGVPRTLQGVLGNAPSNTPG